MPAIYETINTIFHTKNKMEIFPMKSSFFPPIPGEKRWSEGMISIHCIFQLRSAQVRWQRCHQNQGHSGVGLEPRMLKRFFPRPMDEMSPFTI